MGTAGPTNDLSRFLVPTEELQTAEYCYRMKNTNFTQKPKDDGLLKPKLQIINGMLNSSGGILCLVSDTPELEPIVDNWELGFKAQLGIILSDTILNNNIDFTGDGFPIHTLHIFVSRAAELVTLDYGLFIRKNTETRKVTDILTAQRTINATSESLFAISHNWVYNEPPNRKEQHNVEFKHWNTKSSAETIERFKKEIRLHKCMMALANIPTGGYIILGIEESKETKSENTYKTRGVILETAYETVFTDAVQSKLYSYQFDKKNIWGSVDVIPTQGDHWDVTYHPVSNCPSRERRVVIIVEIRHCPGGLFCFEPESYDMSEDGVISKIPFDDWKKRILHSITEAPSDDVRLADTVFRNQDVPSHSMPHDSTPKNSDAARENILKESEKQNDIVDATLARMDKLSWSEHTSDWRKNLHCYDSIKRKHARRAIERVLKTGQPTVFVPEEKIILSSFKNDLEFQNTSKCVSFVKDQHVHSNSIAIASKKWIKTFTQSNEEFDHHLDIFSVDENCKACLTVSSTDCIKEQRLLSVSRDIGRKLKRRLIETHVKLGLTVPKFHIHVATISPSNQQKQTFLDEQCLSIFRPTKSSWKALQEALGLVILCGENTINVKTRLGDEILIQLTIDQMTQIMSAELSRFSLIEGLPGSGKTLLVLYLCRQFDKDNCLVLCLTPGLKAFYDSQGVCQTRLVSNEAALDELLRRGDHLGKRCVIIDDCHNLRCRHTFWRLLFLDVRLQRNAQLILFADNKIQNFEESHSRDRIKEVMDIIYKYTNEECLVRNLSVVHRTSQKVTSFITSHFEDEVVRCAHTEEGDEVEVLKLYNLFVNGTENGLLTLVKGLIQPHNVLAGNKYAYTSKDLAILVDGSYAEIIIGMYTDLLNAHLMTKVHRADTYPVQGLTIDHLENFCGLDAKVVILIAPNAISVSSEKEGITSNGRNILNPRYKAFVASRAIYRVIFVTEANFDRHIADCLNIDNIPVVEIMKTERNSSTDMRLSPVEALPSTTDPRLKSHRLLFHRKLHKTLREVTFLSDGVVLYTAGEITGKTQTAVTVSQNRLYKEDLVNSQPPAPVLTQFTEVSAVSMDSRTQTLAVGDADSRCVVLYKVDHENWICQRQYSGQHVSALAVTGQNVVCARPSLLWMLGEDGQEIWRTSLPTSTTYYRPFVAVDSTGHNIIVSDPNINQVSLFDNHGNFVTTLPTDQTPWPAGVCVTSFDMILVADCDTRTVSMFCTDGRFVQRLINTEVKPHNISLYKDKYLVVGTLRHGLLLYELDWEKQ